MTTPEEQRAARIIEAVYGSFPSLRDLWRHIGTDRASYQNLHRRWSKGLLPPSKHWRSIMAQVEKQGRDVTYADLAWHEEYTASDKETV